ncbi:MAG: hypothetical protein LUC97_11855 [Clostridiales bacterium]|nr:hypothetical protein [Clostridiales bacterium]
MRAKTMLIIAGTFIAVMIILWTAVFVCVSKNFRSSADITETESQTETTIESTVEITTEQVTQYLNFNDDIPDDVWEELRLKSGLSKEEFSKEMKEYENLKNSKSYTWDNSEAPLTDEQIKEIEAEQESILNAINTTIETTTETTSAEQPKEDSEGTPIETASETEQMTEITYESTNIEIGEHIEE